jgi:hypothetical protein
MRMRNSQKEIDREPQELLADYADALRDGRIPGFVRTLTGREAKAMAEKEDLGRAVEMARILNLGAFADKVVWPDVGLFISRVDAKIASRLQHGRAHGSVHHKGMAESLDRSQDSDEGL